MTGRLLVIEDDEASRRLIEATFSAEGFDVIGESNGPAGIDRTVSDRPDVVLLDLHLPNMDGLEVLQRIKAAHSALPVVMLTPSHDVKSAVRAVQLGAFDYLTKPIDRDHIIVSVRRALEVRALRVEVEDLRRRVVEVLRSRDLVIQSDVVRDGIGQDTEREASPVPPRRRPDQSLRSVAEEAARAAERLAIREALKNSGGNKSQAAKALKTDYKTLHLKMKAMKIRAHDFKDR